MDKYLDSAEVYYFDYTGAAPIVGFTSKATDVNGVHDVELVVVAKKTGFAINFADGLVWTDTDERSTVFGGSEPQYPPAAVAGTMAGTMTTDDPVAVPFAAAAEKKIASPVAAGDTPRNMSPPPTTVVEVVPAVGNGCDASPAAGMERMTVTPAGATAQRTAPPAAVPENDNKRTASTEIMSKE